MCLKWTHFHKISSVQSDLSSWKWMHFLFFSSHHFFSDLHSHFWDESTLERTTVSISPNSIDIPKLPNPVVFFLCKSFQMSKSLCLNWKYHHCEYFEIIKQATWSTVFVLAVPAWHKLPKSLRNYSRDEFVLQGSSIYFDLLWLFNVYSHLDGQGFTHIASINTKGWYH